MLYMAKLNTAFQHKNLIPTLKYSGGFVAIGPGQPAIIDGATEAQQKVGPAERQQPWRDQLVYKEWLKQKKSCILEWLSQSPDLIQ